MFFALDESNNPENIHSWGWNSEQSYLTSLQPFQILSSVSRMFSWLCSNFWVVRWNEAVNDWCDQTGSTLQDVGQTIVVLLTCAAESLKRQQNTIKGEMKGRSCMWAGFIMWLIDSSQTCRLLKACWLLNWLNINFWIIMSFPSSAKCEVDSFGLSDIAWHLLHEHIHADSSYVITKNIDYSCFKSSNISIFSYSQQIQWQDQQDWKAGKWKSKKDFPLISAFFFLKFYPILCLLASKEDTNKTKQTENVAMWPVTIAPNVY